MVAPLRGYNPPTVVKWNHDYTVPTSSEECFLRILYKKRKYEMLKFFLGGFIPNTSFVLGNKQDGHVLKMKEYTVQQRVPNHTLQSLQDEQKQDPRLLDNIRILVLKLQNMYRLLDLVNEQVGRSDRLDAKLDLGGLSKYAADNKYSDEYFDWDGAGFAFMTSPNLLVDPITMQLYCIDFGQGVWSQGRENTFEKLIMLANSDARAMQIISM